MFVTISVVLMAIVAVLAAVSAVAFVASVCGGSFRKFFMKGLWALLLPPAVMLYGMIVERNIYNVKRLEITSDKLPAGFDGYRVVHISDIHLRSFKTRYNSLSHAVAQINALDPDIVLFTGDLVTAEPSEMDSLETILAGLHASDGVYSVLGNHDYCIYNRWPSDSVRQEAVKEVIRRQEAMGWKMLMNRSVNLVRGADTVSVAGVENISQTSYFPSYGDLDSAMSGARGAFKILMSHDPSHWKKATEQYPDIDLTLSGHTHAMQFTVFGWSPSSFIFDEYMGLYCMDSERSISSVHRHKVAQNSANMLYVNIGLGETAIPARLGGARPEITLITLRNSGAVSNR